MARTASWNAAHEGRYHNNTDCEPGVRAVRGSREGTGGKRLCPTCAALNENERAIAQYSVDGEILASLKAYERETA